MFNIKLPKLLFQKVNDSFNFQLLKNGVVIYWFLKMQYYKMQIDTDSLECNVFTQI